MTLSQEETARLRQKVCEEILAYGESKQEGTDLTLTLDRILTICELTYAEAERAKLSKITDEKLVGELAQILWDCSPEKKYGRPILKDMAEGIQERYEKIIEALLSHLTAALNARQEELIGKVFSIVDKELSFRAVQVSTNGTERQNAAYDTVVKIRSALLFELKGGQK